MTVVTVESHLGWQPDADEHRRAFIIENCAPYEWSISDMADLYVWLKTGVIDGLSKPNLRPVK